MLLSSVSLVPLLHFRCLAISVMKTKENDLMMCYVIQMNLPKASSYHTYHTVTPFDYHLNGPSADDTRSLTRFKHAFNTQRWKQNSLVFAKMNKLKNKNEINDLAHNTKARHLNGVLKPKWSTGKYARTNPIHMNLSHADEKIFSDWERKRVIWQSSAWKT